MPLTPYQELAAASRGGARLISAAAGSGKTRVLVERLMRYVDEGANIDDFLVVTYTRAAAGELRSRILAALNERMARSPANKRLRRQTELCCRAAIGTIDSICGRILRENAHLAGIAPDFRVVEPDRAAAIRQNVLEKLLDGIYETLDAHPGRRALIDSFGYGRDDAALSDLLLRLHDAVQSHPHPVGWLREQRAGLAVAPGTDAGATEGGQYLLRRTAAQADYWAERMDALLAAMAQPGREKLWKAYGASVSATGSGLRAMGRAAAVSWERAVAAAVVEFPRLGSYRGDDPLAGEVKAARTECKKVCDGWKHTYADSSDTLIRELEATRPAMEALLELTEALEGAYAAEKRRQGVVDFSDQEHMVLRLLEDRSNGLADGLSARYREVLVDEYQDVNACQDALFTLLSHGGRRLFLVGDVKQSIYRFRLADPGIFLDRYGKWPDVTPGLPPEDPGRILLRENFRSRPEILAAANHVFENIMSPELGELSYDDAAALRPGLEPPAEGDKKVKLTVLSLPPAEEETEERPDALLREAEYIAGQIRAMVDSGVPVTDGEGVRPAGYGDFAILLRSHKSTAGRFRAALAQRGIPSVAQQGGGFFRSLEVTVLLSLLAVIDNPRQDVALIATLRSPLYGFTADELAAIRAADKETDFYTALTEAAETMPHCAAFLTELEGYRQLAADLSVEALLGRICDKRDLYALLSAMPDADTRRENVRLLTDYARQFELDGYRGIFRFIDWMRRLEQRGEEPRTGSVEQRQAVQIISIHHSKGLEYPIVFLANTARRFNKSDSGPTVLVHPRLGVGGKVIDTARGIKYPSLAWRAIAAKLEEETLSEEMRVLYVAMTRARDRLYISCLWHDAQKELEKLRLGLTSPIAPELLRRDLSPACWLVRAALLPDSPMELVVETAGGGLEDGDAPTVSDSDAPSAEPETDLRRRLDWQYPAGWAAQLPSKLTASALQGTALPDPDARDISPESRRRADPRRPVLGGERPLTGAERGTAVHMVLQFIDYAKCGSLEGIRGEIARLRELGHLTEQQAAAADPALIWRFFASETGRRVLAAEQVWRELRFSLLVGAEEFFPVPAGEQVLLQGVVDCCIREGSALTVIDYKTDYVTADTLSDKVTEYAPQLRSYAGALERILGLPVREGVLVFLRTGEAVRVPLNKK